MPDIHPPVVERGEQLYAFVRGTVRMDAFAPIADRLPELFGWLTSRGAELAAPPSSASTASTWKGSRRSRRASPSCPCRSPREISAVREWAEREGLEWDMTVVDGAERWACRLESYLTDPRVEPDPSKWEIELAFRLAD
ncbi:GyrI-like domain-containing protein [Streptomyces sp. NBC_00322]|uniref:GyrI-like domain-containing protein n=1 Tax=Streptomyces sp. NBC_00322 TaxID=2975712 RepID=UPI002E2895FA|nr:GyrI-like domain-containing protein [Streptomyces sp. NBC_00322]